jgi:hypothetical protein
VEISTDAFIDGANELKVKSKMLAPGVYSYDLWLIK